MARHPERAGVDARLGAAGAEARHPDAGGVAWGLRQGVKKPTAGSRPPSAKRKTFCGPAAIRHLGATHLLFSMGLSAPKALGKPQYLAPVAQTMR